MFYGEILAVRKNRADVHKRGPYILLRSILINVVAANTVYAKISQSVVYNVVMLKHKIV